MDNSTQLIPVQDLTLLIDIVETINLATVFAKLVTK